MHARVRNQPRVVSDFHTEFDRVTYLETALEPMFFECGGEVAGVSAQQGPNSMVTQVPYGVVNLLTHLTLTVDPPGNATFEITPFLIARAGFGSRVGVAPRVLVVGAVGQQQSFDLDLPAVFTNSLRASVYRAGLQIRCFDIAGADVKFAGRIQGALIVSDPLVVDVDAKFLELLEQRR